MNKTKFTPGPWESRIGTGIEVGHDGVAIAEIWLRGDRQTEEANANLIAAAPDLYEALEELYAEQNGPPLEKYKTSWEKAIRKTEAALAKARGEA